LFNEIKQSSFGSEIKRKLKQLEREVKYNKGTKLEL